MAAGYMFTEVARGLRRNITMTIAMVLTTAISLCLLGGGLIIARMTDQMRAIYGDKVEVTVYLTAAQSTSDPDCHDAVCQGLGTKLSHDADVDLYTYQSQAAAWQEYQQLFANQPEMIDIASEAALNASYHVKLKDPQQYREVIARYSKEPGVKSVTDQSAILDRLFGVLNGVRNATIIVALVQAFASLLLISNMVQIAAFTRRTETSIMRLVGASRWRTQMPFIVEAIVAAAIGAVVAIFGLVGMKYVFIDKTLGSVMRAGILPPVDASALVWVTPWLAGIAIALAALSAYVTLRLYVRL
jgi:cell division transport system permease protein